VIYWTDLGQSADARSLGIALDQSGTPYFAGTSSSPQFPAHSGVPNAGADFVVSLDASGTHAQRLFRFPSGVAGVPPTFDGTTGDLLVPGTRGSLVTIPAGYAFDSPGIVGFANSASLDMDTGLYPGTLVILFGFDLPASADQVQVNFGTRRAPVLYSAPNQINIQVPWQPGMQMTVVLPNGTIPLTLPSEQALGIFTTDGNHAATLNQDGSVNSASNPAVRGSIISLFGTGATWPSGMQDGAIATQATVLPHWYDYTIGAPIEYLGSAPELINGVFQVNVQIPADAVIFSPGIVYLTLSNGSISSNGIQVYVQQ
jgi:uncharacterized protein (TIGR03437 family)